MKLCEFDSERAPEVQMIFDHKGNVYDIGRQIWVPALTLLGEKCCPYHATLCAGTKVPFMALTSGATSFAGSLGIQLPMREKSWYVQALC